MNDTPHYHGHRARLRERFERDASGLADYEVLELLLGYALPRRDVKPLAKAILARCKTLRGALDADPAELADLDGFGPGCQTFFGLWREVFARVGESAVRAREVLSDPASVAAFAMARLGALRTEEFWVALVDNKNRLLAWERVSKGTVDQAAVFPREVMALALARKAKAMVLVHNHPGGDPKPSTQDVDLTRRLARAATDLGMQVLDHVVVTENSFYSFQERGLL